MTTSVQRAEEQLVTLEEQAAADASAAVEQTIAVSGLTAAAIAAAVPAVTAVIQQAVARAVRVGAAIAAAAAAAGVRRLHAVRAAYRAVPGIDVAGRVRDVMSTAAVAIERAEGAEQVRTEVDRVKAQLRAVATTAVNEGVSAGADAAARLLGASGLMWVAERDSCLHCQALSGHVLQLGQRFPAGVTFADRPLLWRGYTGRPPRHPHCRCRVKPVFGDASKRSTALQREAQRSVVRGFSLQSESEPARLRAAARLLRRGANLPRSVEAYGRRAVRERRFPRGRQVPTGAGRRTR